MPFTITQEKCCLSVKIEGPSIQGIYTKLHKILLAMDEEETN